MKVLVPALAAGTIAVGGGAAYYFLKVQPAQDVANPISSFEILPKETIAAGYLSFDEDTWRKANKFGTQQARDLFISRVEQIKSAASRETLSGEPLDFDQDIKPWLGSVTIAGVAVQEEGVEPASIVVIGIKDKLEALKFATSQKDKAGSSAQVSQYKGVDIYEFTDNTNQFLAVLDNHLVFSNVKSQVEATIDVEQGADSALTNPEVNQALEQSITAANPVAAGFVNLPSLIEQVEKSSDSNTAASNEAIFADLKKYQAAAMSWEIEDQGFRFKNVIKHSFDQEWSFDPLPGKVISRFPENTLALVHGGYLDQAWSLAVRQLESNSDSRNQLERFRREFSRATQLDLEQDVLSWMDGEFGLGVLPANDGVLAQIGFGGALAIETSDQAKASGTLDKFQTLAQSMGAQISNKQINGIEVTQFGVPLQPALVNYGWLDNETLLLSLGESTAISLSEATNSSVRQNSIYQSLTGTLPSLEKGSFYVNAEEFLATARSSPTVSSALAANPEMDAVLSSFQGLAMAADQPDSGTAIGEALLTFRQP
ncbi:MAG: DUF3352 domain-containing protein [Cyanobacteria bacterium P01_F01_bin.42]